jgi:hypothetical protein
MAQKKTIILRPGSLYLFIFEILDGVYEGGRGALVRHRKLVQPDFCSEVIKILF